MTLLIAIIVWSVVCYAATVHYCRMNEGPDNLGVNMAIQMLIVMIGFGAWLIGLIAVLIGEIL